MKAKIISTIIVVFALIINTVTYITVSAEKSGDYEYTALPYNKAEITKYIGSETTIRVPGRIDGRLVTSIGENAFSDCTDLKKIDIHSDVVKIADNAFDNLNDLTIVCDVFAYPYEYATAHNIDCITREPIYDVPVRIYSDFEYKIWFGENIIITKYNGKNASITIPHEIAGKEVTSIGEKAFAGKTDLKYVRIPSSITSISDSAFDGCKKNMMFVFDGYDLDSNYNCPNTYVSEYAKKHNIEYFILENAPTEPTTNNVPTSTWLNTNNSKTADTAKKSDLVKGDKTDAQKTMKQANITKLTAKSKAKKKISVSWRKVKKSKGYQVQVSSKKNFKKIVYKKLTSKNKLTIKNEKIKSGKKYFVRVRAYASYKDKNGKTQKVYGKWSNQLVRVTTK